MPYGSAAQLLAYAAYLELLPKLKAQMKATYPEVCLGLGISE